MSNYETIYNSSYLFEKDSYNELKRDLVSSRDKAACYKYIIEKLEGFLSLQGPSTKKLLELFNQEYIVKGYNITTATITAFHDIVFKNYDLIDDLKELLMVNEIDWISPNQRERVTQIIAGVIALNDILKEIKDEYELFLSQNINKIHISAPPVKIEEDFFPIVPSSLRFSTQKVCALFYVYLQETNYIDHFINMNEIAPQYKLLQNIAEKHGFDSGDNLGKKYSLVTTVNKRLRYLKEIKEVLELLEKTDFTEAYKQAKNELTMKHK